MPSVAPRRILRARARVTCAFGLVVAVLAIAVPSAHADYALTTHPDYTATALDTACMAFGSTDDTGTLYMPCNGVIRRYSRTGARGTDIPVPNGVSYPLDAAPSPDGAYLYLTQGPDTPVRLNRTATGSYVLDPTWRLKNFYVWNVGYTPVGNNIAVDGRGDIYFSNSSFWIFDTQSSVAKFKPDGTFLTAFGDYGREDGNWITNQDIAVSRDGRRVFVGENCGKSCIYSDPEYTGSRVTRYDFSPGGTYRFSRVVSAQGPMDDNPFPRCTSDGATHSAYALGLDFQENLYATSTTCGRIQMWDTDPDPAKDRFLKSVAVYTDPDTASGVDGKRNHHMAVDWQGRIYANEWGYRFTPKVLPPLPTLPLPAVEPLPAPDIKAPVISNVTVPVTTSSRTIQVTTTATDDRGVAEMQLAREDGNWGPWQPFASPVSWDVSANYGVKGVYVRVRDMAGNESIAVYRTLSYAAPVDPADPPPAQDVADPVLVSVTVPAVTATRDVQVTLEATDDTAVRQVRFANEDGNWTAWQAYAATKPWTLSAGQGGKAIYAQVRDGVGRESGTLMARTSYSVDAPPPPPPGGAPDVTAPVLSSLTLPGETTTQVVTARLVATDGVGVAQVRFANEDGNWTAWKAWAADQQWTLSAGFGAKLVYAQVRDAAGNESLVLTAKSSFVKTAAGPVDAADPALTAVVIPNPTPTSAVTVTLTATDDVGVTEVRFANEDGTWQAWKPFAAQVPHTLTAGAGLKAVYAQVRDAAGRESNVLFVRTQVTA
jgi:hypothetical protein